MIKKQSSKAPTATQHNEIESAFIKRYGEKAGWAHQIVFAGDLTSFQDKLKVETPKKVVPKKRS